MHRLVVERDDDVVLLQPGLFRRSVLDDLGQLGAHVGVLAAHAQVGRVLRLFRDLLRFQHDVDRVGFLAVEVDADAAQFVFRQPLRDLAPGFSAVGGFVQPAAGAHFLGGIVGVESVALPLVGGGQDRVGIVRLQFDVNHAGLVVDVEYLLPRLAAVGGLVEPAGLVRPPEPPERSNVDDVRISGVNHDSARLKSLVEPHVFPGLAAVGRFVDAVAP